MSNDWVIRHHGRWFQLHPGSDAMGPLAARHCYANGRTEPWRCTIAGKQWHSPSCVDRSRDPQRTCGRLFFTLPYRRIILSPLVPSLRSRLRPSGYSNMEDAMRVSLIILSLACICRYMCGRRTGMRKKRRNGRATSSESIKTGRKWTYEVAEPACPRI